MRLGLIIIHYGKQATTQACLQALRPKIGSHRLILINNTAEDIPSLAKIIPTTYLIENKKNIGFAKAVNQGLKYAMSQPDLDAFFLLNNDLGFLSGSIDSLLKLFRTKPTAGILSPVLKHGHGVFDWGGRYQRWTASVKHRNYELVPKMVLQVDHIAGAAMLIHRRVVEKIGYFDERFFLYFEDLDYCLRTLAAGFTIHISPDLVLTHSVSAGSRALRRTLYQWHSHLQFVSKHLFKYSYPTAYLYSLVFYPLVILKITLKGSNG